MARIGSDRAGVPGARPLVAFPARYNAAADLLDTNLEHGRADQTAIRSRERDLTYRELADEADRASGGLLELGLRTGQRVLFALDDCPELIAGFLGAIRIGAVPIAVNPAADPRELGYVVRDSLAQVAVIGEAVAGRLRPYLPRSHHLRHLVVVGSAEASELAWAEVVGQTRSQVRTAATRPDQACFWIYTVGSSGVPRAAVHRHQDMRVCVEQWGRPVLGMCESDTVFSAAKLSSSYGLVSSLFLPLGTGGTTVLMAEPPAPPLVFDAIRKYRPTVFFAVPTGYANSLAWTGADFSSVRVCVSAGEPLSGSLLQRWRGRIGVEILEVYGSTELAVVISNDLGHARPDSAGRLVAGCQARIVDGDGCDVPDGETGRLLIRSAASSRSYWRRPVLSRRTFLGDWTATGDLFRQDEAGYYYFEGRTDDMLKVGGQWVSPAQVEAVLRRHDSVRACALSGVVGEDRLVRLQAHLVLRKGSGDPAEVALQIRRRLRSELPAYKWPRDLLFVKTLPKSRSTTA